MTLLPSPPPLPKLHALLVGINKYPGSPHLQSATKDAKRLQTLLESKWDKSMLRVLSLHDSAATKEAITNQISALQLDKEVSRGDAIVFFFSGYSGRSEVKESADGKESAKKVGAICPTDFMENGAISDEALAKLFYQLGRACGTNIVSDPILHHETRKLMFSPINQTVFLDCDSTLFNWEYPIAFVAVAPRNATETPTGGVFTTSLHKVLEEIFDSKTLDLFTVQSLADRIQADMCDL